MFENIKLDDRSYDEIKDEVIAKISSHCPEWSNHNPSDPGITLVELFAYMTEMTQFRLNQVPQKNYLAFLDLLGIKQRLSIPARSRACFDLSIGYEMDKASKTTVLVPQRTEMTTSGDEENRPLIFETNNAINISNTKLLNLYSKSYDKARSKSNIIDYTPNLETLVPFAPFSKDGRSENKIEIYFNSDTFSVLKDEVNMTILFRLPTTMRQYGISENFLSDMEWHYHNGEDWQQLRIQHHLSVMVDDTDADVVSVTFEGGCADLEKILLTEFSKEENYFVRAIFQETPDYLSKLSIYEVSVITNSSEAGVIPDYCFHNYETLDLNGGLYPFGQRPTLDNAMMDEIFYIQCDQAFCEEEAIVEINFEHSKSSEYTMPTGYDNLKIRYEYAVDDNKWKVLDVKDKTSSFTKSGTVSFKIPEDFNKIILNAEEGYWIRARIIAGHYGVEETTTYDNTTGEVKTTMATLNPPFFTHVNIKYSKKRFDLESCNTFNNYQFNPIKFDKNRAVNFFKEDNDPYESLYLGFDSYLSEQSLELYFDIQKSDLVLDKQRILEFEVLQNGKWKRLKVQDSTDGLTHSGDVVISLPEIEKLEEYSLYIDAFERMWIKISVKYSALKTFPKINRILLNSVEIVQRETIYNEVIAHSDGLPNMKFKLEKDNLIGQPKILVAEEEYFAVERFIDSGKSDKVFRFNGITGEIEFGDGEFGFVPPLGEEIVVQEYQVSDGKRGNVSQGSVNILNVPINYVDSVSNIFAAHHAQDGDSIEDLKRFAPSVLKSMQRAVTFEDYEHLSINYSPYIKKAKAMMYEGELVVLIMSHTILSEKGFINRNFIKKLTEYLEKLSMVTIHPRVQSVMLREVKLKLKLKYTNEHDVPQRAKLETELLQKAETYLNPLKSSTNRIGRSLQKSDVIQIVNSSTSSLILSELLFVQDGIEHNKNSIDIAYNEVIVIEDLIIDELNYDF
jgi:hypothetical protein